MAGRIRSIKPEWNESESLGSCSDAARVLSVSLILLADDHGRGRAHPSYLAAQAWPYSGANVEKARLALAELVAAGFVALYEVKGSIYFQLPGWGTHQRVDKPGKPKVPDPSLGKVPETLANLPEALEKIPLGTEGNRREQKGKGTEGECEGKGRSAAPREKKLSPVALELADRLREAVLAAKPNDRAGEDDAWEKIRRGWARALAPLLERRTGEAIQAAMAYLARGQDGAEFPFVVLSAKSFVEKFDRIEVAMSRPRGRAASPGRGLSLQEIRDLDMNVSPFRLGGDR